MATALLYHPHPYPHPLVYPSHNSYLRNNVTLPLHIDIPKKMKPSLPSISSLIEAADGPLENTPHRANQEEAAQNVPPDAHSPSHGPERPNTILNPSRGPLPPTPPLRPRSTSDAMHPSTFANSSQPFFPPPNHGYYSNTPTFTNPEPYSQRQVTYPPRPRERLSLPLRNQPPIYTNQPFDTPNSAPGGSLQASPVDGNPYAGLTHQRPLPTNFPPPLPPVTFPPSQQMMSQTTPTWQHHHYFPPSASASYPQSQERYVCPTCSKPFSRPSSLKIHTYSHTGEKPYRCKHDGCGKWFSVRSNMKRHEKGCHSDNGSTQGVSPSSV